MSVQDEQTKEKLELQKGDEKERLFNCIRKHGNLLAILSFLVLFIWAKTLGMRHYRNIFLDFLSIFVLVGAFAILCGHGWGGHGIFSQDWDKWNDAQKKKEIKYYIWEIIIAFVFCLGVLFYDYIAFWLK